MRPAMTLVQVLFLLTVAYQSPLEASTLYDDIDDVITDMALADSMYESPFGIASYEVDNKDDEDKWDTEDYMADPHHHKKKGHKKGGHKHEHKHHHQSKCKDNYKHCKHYVQYCNAEDNDRMRDGRSWNVYMTRYCAKTCPNLCSADFQACQTTSRKMCIFPFSYKGKSYSSCTAEDHTALWCPTSLHKGSIAAHHWGECEDTEACKGSNTGQWGPFVNEDQEDFQHTFVNNFQPGSCKSGYEVKTNLKFRIQRQQSWHQTQVIYIQHGATHAQLFQFAHPPDTQMTVLSFDGNNLLCSGDPFSHKCNSLAFNVPTPAVILSVNIRPREGFVPDGNWQRNRFSLSGSFYAVSCAPCKTTSNIACVFPFKYKRNTYLSCTSVDHSQKWCATSVDKRGYVTGYNWGNCDSTTCE